MLLDFIGVCLEWLACIDWRKMSCSCSIMISRSSKFIGPTARSSVILLDDLISNKSFLAIDLCFPKPCRGVIECDFRADLKNLSSLFAGPCVIHDSYFLVGSYL